MGLRVGSFVSQTSGEEIYTLGITDACVVINANVTTTVSAKTNKNVSKCFLGGYLIYLNGKFNAVADPDVDGKQVLVFLNGKATPLFLEDGSINPSIPIESDKVATVDIAKYTMPS